MDKYLKEPIRPFDVSEDSDIETILKKMEHISFQAKNLHLVYEIWKKMLLSECTIFLGIAGAMVPAGMRKIFAYLVKNRYIDCIVSTGANLFHCLCETLGKHHWKGNANVDDTELFKKNIDRIYDVFAKESDFRECDNFVEKFAASLDCSRPYTTREFFYYLGKRLNESSKEDGILNTAYKYNVPIYCPALGDSSIGIAIAKGKVKGSNNLIFDIIEDVIETSDIAIKSKCTGVIYIGGGTPKNFIQQTAITSSVIFDDYRSHKYAIQIITDPPHWGGLSGCTFEEAKSWGKIAADSEMVSIYSDAIVVLPIIVSALASLKIKRKKIPQFNIDKKKIEMDLS